MSNVFMPVRYVSRVIARVPTSVALSHIYALLSVYIYLHDGKFGLRLVYMQIKRMDMYELGFNNNA